MPGKLRLEPVDDQAGIHHPAPVGQLDRGHLHGAGLLRNGMPEFPDRRGTEFVRNILEPRLALF